VSSRRQKHVYPTNEISHLWFHKTQASARNAQANLYFEGETIYSYGSHFPIARHVVDNPTKKNPKPAILFTTRSWSVTTSGHVSAVRSAIPKDVPVFHVYNPALSPRESLACYVSAVEENAKSASERKMETTRNEDVQRALSLIVECKAFCKFFGLKIPTFAKLPKIDAEKLKRQQDAQKAREDARMAKRRAESEAWAAQRRAEREESDRMADLDAVALLVNIDGHHFVAHGNEIELLAIAAPTGPMSAICGSLPHAISGREWNDKNLRSPVRQHGEGNKPAVRRELSARLSAGVRDGQHARFFLGIERNNADFGISARQIDAFRKQITAIGRPVRGAIGRGEFL